MWVCTDCSQNSKYESCATTFETIEDAIEHARKDHIDIRRPGAVGCSDSHGHVWYCFSCETDWNDHRSFDSHEAMFRRMRECHPGVIEKFNSDDGGWCDICYN